MWTIRVCATAFGNTVSMAPERPQTLGDEVMATTKTRKRYAIDLPEEAMKVLRWHLDTQLDTPEIWRAISCSRA